MKKLIIADITTLTSEDKIYGHFLKVAQQYKTILEKNFDCYICGGQTYRNYFNEKYIKLPFFINKKNTTKPQKILVKLKEFINSIIVLNQYSDIVIFQCYSELPIFLSILITRKYNKKIYLIQYQKGLKSKLLRIIYSKVSKKIDGIITSSHIVGKHYGIDYIVLPDYFPSEMIDCKNKEDLKYDFTLLGTVSDGKDYESIIEKLKDKAYKVKIVGKFFDEKRLNIITEQATENIKIENKYLTEEEYNSNINQSKYIVLPYKEGYENKSSGVVLDAIYRRTPVIATNLNSFRFIEENGLGLVYKKSILEILDELNEENYKLFKMNIDKFIKEKEKEKEKFIEFIAK